jgi:hypothetical protein
MYKKINNKEDTNEEDRGTRIKHSKEGEEE